MHHRIYVEAILGRHRHPYLCRCDGAWAATTYVIDWLGRADTVINLGSPTGILAKAAAWSFSLLWELPATLSGLLVIGWLWFGYHALVVNVVARRSPASLDDIVVNSVLDAIMLRVGSGEMFEDDLWISEDTIRRTLRAAVRNRGNGFLSNCEVAIEGLVPRMVAGGFATNIKSRFTLLPGEERFVDVAVHDACPSTPTTGRIVIPLPVQPGYGTFSIGPARDYRFTLKAVSTNSRPSHVNCRLYIDPSSSRLRLEQL